MTTDSLLHAPDPTCMWNLKIWLINNDLARSARSTANVITVAFHHYRSILDPAAVSGNHNREVSSEATQTVPKRRKQSTAKLRFGATPGGLASAFLAAKALTEQLSSFLLVVAIMYDAGRCATGKL